MSEAPVLVRHVDDHLLDLLELVDPIETLRVLPVGPGLAPVAGGLRDELHREVRCLEDLVLVKRRHRHLRRPHQAEIVTLVTAIGLILTAGEVAGAHHRLAPDERRDRAE